ncbi:hypothetical protein CCHR01_19075 [Colletotrichum chrysophilum]|uniref:Uncharacterized protein n=1 Tax=Colletotrichum chrysophilum TaxID=1836956 RepID=A0AAD8ZYW8_9PEZI|nr:hypothetical protein CCHR01_19075 [Colletotrichum chrysophilum]
MLSLPNTHDTLALSRSLARLGSSTWLCALIFATGRWVLFGQTETTTAALGKSMVPWISVWLVATSLTTVFFEASYALSIAEEERRSKMGTATDSSAWASLLCMKHAGICLIFAVETEPYPPYFLGILITLPLTLSIFLEPSSKYAIGFGGSNESWLRVLPKAEHRSIDRDSS